VTSGVGRPEGLVLRVFRAYEDPLRASYEEAIHNALVDQGYPAPRVHLACADPDVLGGSFVVMDHLAGRPLLADFLSPSTLFRLRTRAFGFVSRLIAELQPRLHALDPEALLEAVKAAGVPSEAGPGRLSLRSMTFEGQLGHMDYRITNARLGGLSPGLQWLLQNRPQERERVICHGDFHPLNIMSERGRVTGVIDWQQTALADPAFEVGNTLMLLTLSPVGTGGASGAIAAIRRSTARRYLRAYLKARPLNPTAISYYEAYRCLRSLTWVGESRQAVAGVIEDRGPNPWHPPAVAARLIARFQEISSVAVALPPS